MLVRSMEQGRDLAATLGGNACVLMRGHGAVVAAGVRGSERGSGASQDVRIQRDYRYSRLDNRPTPLSHGFRRTRGEAAYGLLG